MSALLADAVAARTGAGLVASAEAAPILGWATPTTVLSISVAQKSV